LGLGHACLQGSQAPEYTNLLIFRLIKLRDKNSNTHRYDRIKTPNRPPLGRSICSLWGFQSSVIGADVGFDRRWVTSMRLGGIR
jgi:hypothetical protein